MNNRRKLVFALAGLALPSQAALAQTPNKVWRIGFLGFGAAANSLVPECVKALAGLGYIDGKNAEFEIRHADGKPERLPALAAELIDKKVTVIFAENTPVIQAVKQLSGTIPIVFASAADPVYSGFAASLRQPGGNITGITIRSPELSAKRLQLLKSAAPKIKRVAVCASNTPLQTVQYEEITRAAGLLNLKLLKIQAEGPEKIERSTALIKKWRADALYVTESPTHAFNRALLVQMAERLRLPAIYGARIYVEAGGMISYGVDYADNYRRAATYIDKILKGALPKDLPIEQPNRYELVLNQKTATALGLKMPESILIQATTVIE